MTNILSLPQLDGSQTVFTVAQNADWRDAIYFVAPGSPSSPVTQTCSITSASNTISSLPTTIGLLPGMPISQGFGIPAGGMIGAILSSTSVSMVLFGTSTPLNATGTNPEESVTFQPIPLDITGISFTMQLRQSTTNPWAPLTISTANGLLVNGGTSGALGWNVSSTYLGFLPTQTYVADLIAQGDGATINLFQSGPCTVVLTLGETR